VKRAIIEGEWAEVEKFCSKSSIRSMKNFLYCVYKQQYLELVDRQEYQKAFTYLTKKLKPYEGHQSHPEEFRNLCYLLTCKSISDVEKEWDGIAAARNRLAGMFGSLMTDSEMTDKAGADGHIEAPPGRLLELLEQAVEFQISSSRYQPRFLPPITSLLRVMRIPRCPAAAATTTTTTTTTSVCHTCSALAIIFSAFRDLQYMP